MSKFQLVAATVQVIKTEDGKEFSSMEEATSHQNMLDAAAVIATPVQAYLNANKMIDRNRKQKQTVVEAAFAFLVAQGVDLSGVAAVERTVEDTPVAEKVADVAVEVTTETTPEAAPSEEEEDGDLF